MTHYIIRTEGIWPVNGLAQQEPNAGERYSTSFDDAPGRSVNAIAPDKELATLQQAIVESLEVDEDRAIELARRVFRRIGAEEVELRAIGGELFDDHGGEALDVHVHLGGPSLAMAKYELNHPGPEFPIIEGNI